MRSTQALLDKIEGLLKAIGYNVRYEKGNFRGGYCILDTKRLVVVNKFYPVEGRVNTLAEVVNAMELDLAGIQGLLSEEQVKLVFRLREKGNEKKAGGVSTAEAQHEMAA